MSTRAISRTLIAAALLVAALALGACGGGGGDGDRAVRGSDATAGGAVRDGGILTLGATIGVEQLDPNTINSSVQQQLLTLLWNGLTRWGPGMTVEPDLAESWTSTPDNKTWTFKLREGVSYHDGFAFTAQEAVQNIQRVLDPRVPAQVAAKLKMIRSVREIDPLTLQIQLSRPNAELPASLIEVKMTDVGRIDAINERANGTGPYMLKRFVPGQEVQLVRNDDYWGGRPPLDAIHIVRYADETAAEAAFRGGDLSMLWSVPPNNVGSLVSASDGQVLQSEQPAGAVVWELDTTSPPFDDPRARLALAHAADRETMFEAAYSGFGVVNEVDSIVSPKSPFYADDLTPHAFDLDEAKRLFTEAGVREGDEITFWTIAGSFPEWTTMAEILQQDLAKIGVELVIRKAELTKWSQRFYPAPKRFPGLIAANFLSFPPLPATYSLQWFGPDGTCECNWTAPPAYGDALSTSIASSDESARASAFDELQGMLNEAVPIVVLANSAPVSVADANIRGAWVQSDGAVHLETAGFAAGGGAPAQ
jgi:peptide/nickel transport system substrate-binding protein